MDGEVHLGQAPGALVGLLAVDRDVVAAAAVGEDELLGLDEHAAGTAARVVDPARVRLKHLDQQPDDAGGRVELAAALALGAGELLQEVLVDLAEHVAGLLLAVAGEAGVADQVDQLAQAALVNVVRLKIFGRTPVSDALVFMIASIALSISSPMPALLACAAS